MITIKQVALSFMEEQILKNLSNLIEKEISEAVEIIIFGSRARGDSNENSDLDVAIILNVPRIDKEIWNRLWNIKWKVLESLDTEEFPISLFPTTLRDFISKDFDIEKVIKKEGIVIWERKS